MVNHYLVYLVTGVPTDLADCLAEEATDHIGETVYAHLQVDASGNTYLTFEKGTTWSTGDVATAKILITPRVLSFTYYDLYSGDALDVV
ncbi:hypothetical protein IAT40_007282 [Kwoniella sp. CBS 6097]